MANKVKKNTLGQKKAQPSTGKQVKSIYAQRLPGLHHACWGVDGGKHSVGDAEASGRRRAGLKSFVKKKKKEKKEQG